MLGKELMIGWSIMNLKKICIVLYAQKQKRTKMAYPGCNRLRIDVAKDHASTKLHRKAVEEAQLQHTAAKSMMATIQSKKDAIYNMFDIMFIISKENLAILKLDSLSNLASRCGGSVQK